MKKFIDDMFCQEEVVAFARSVQDEHVDQVVVERLLMVVEQRRGVLKPQRAEEVRRYVKMKVEAKRN